MIQCWLDVLLFILYEVLLFTSLPTIEFISCFKVQSIYIYILVMVESVYVMKFGSCHHPAQTIVVQLTQLFELSTRLLCQR
jgi:hypothetical protein